MAKILLCTGKKKDIAAMNNHFKSLASKKTIKILATKQYSKKVLIWGYEELRILFHLEQPTQKLEIETKLLQHLDYYTIKERGGIVAKVRTPTKEDQWLKFNVLKSAAAFRRGGGQLEIKENVDKTRPERVKRSCHITATGPVNLVFGFIELLESESLIDNKSLEYLI